MSSASLYILAVLLYVWLFSSRENENKSGKTFFKKIFVALSSLVFIVLSKDSKGVGPKYNPDPDLIKNKKSVSKTIIFVRY